MKKTYQALLFVAIILQAAMLQAQWTNVGNADFSGHYAGSTSLAFDDGGIPYIAFSDGTQGGKATVMKYTGGAWVVVGSAGFSPGSATYLSLAIRGASPIVAFSDASNGGKATAMKFNSSNNWVNIGTADFSAGSAYNTTIAIDSAGFAYVAYTDVANSNKATVMTYNGSNWVSVGSAGFTSAAASYPAMVIKGSTPYVVYSSGGSSITVMSYNGSNWVTEGNAGFGGNPQSVAMAVDNTGGLYVTAPITSNGGSVYAYKLEGSTWTQLGSGALSAGVGSAPQIAVDANNTPYVAYQDVANNSKGTLMKYTGTAWQAVGAAGFTPGKAYSVSVAIGPGDAPYVAFADDNDTNKVTLMTYGGTASINAIDENMVSVYPNPVKTDFVINCTAAIESVTVLDLDGRVVMQAKQPSSNHFDISNFAPGMYLVKISTAEQVYLKKIVKD